MEKLGFSEGEEYNTRGISRIRNDNVYVRERKIKVVSKRIYGENKEYTEV